MNALGLSLAWMAVQATLFCSAGTIAYLAARRRDPVWRAWILCGVLTMTAGIACLSLGPWPRWWALPDARPAKYAPATTAGAPARGEPAAASSLPAAGAATSLNSPTGSEAHMDVASLLSRLWTTLDARIADVSPNELDDAGWRWPAGLAAVMFTGTGVGLARVLLGVVALTKLLRGTRPVDDAALLGLVAQLRTGLLCRRPIEVREMTCCGGGSPAVVGWRRPIILLPADWRSWSEEERRGILAHETAHVAHGDSFTWLAAQVGVVVHFYNPLVHWLARRLRLEQELAADARGAAQAGGAKAYATVLARMALGQDRFRPLWAGRPFFPTRGTLMRRIEMLQNQPFQAPRRPSQIGRVILLAALGMLGLVISGVRGPAHKARAEDGPVKAKDTAKTESQTASGGLLPAFDDSYLPADTIAAASIKRLRVPGSSAVLEPALVVFPMSFGFAFATTDNGVDEVKTIVFSPTSRDEKEPAIVEIYRMRKPYERSKLRVKIFGEAPDGVIETTCHGHPCFRAAADMNGFPVNYLMVDDRTIVIVRDRDVPRVLAADAQSHPSWWGEWQKVADSPLAVGFDSAAMDALEERKKDSAEEIFFSLLKNTSHFFARVDSTAGGTVVTGKALCKSPQAAAEASQAARAAVALARLAIPQLIVPSELPQEYQAVDIAGPLTQSLGGLSIEANDTRVNVQLKLDAGFVAQLAEATKKLSARQAEEYHAREKTDEQAHLAKLGRLVEAFNAYHDEHGHYPPAALAGPDGKTLHSWRVELLPYLGEQKLFDEYRLDEPWDSGHNKPLVEKIPSIYSTSVWSRKGDADYFVVTGKGTLFDAAAAGRRESVADAPGETILVLQSRQLIPWTKPLDIETTDDHDALRPFRGHAGFYAAFADGTVKLVSKATDPASIRAMFTKAGGDEVKLR